MDTFTNQTWIDGEFPGLEYEVTSESDEDYNCIAWAIGHNDTWWSHLPGYRWIGRRTRHRKSDRHVPRTAIRGMSQRFDRVRI